MKRIFSILLAVGLVLAFSLMATTPVAAATLTVNTSLPNTPPNYHTIQAAIDAASSGDIINVAAGTYTEYLHITTDGLTIQGAGIDQSIIDLDGLMPYWHYDSCSSSYASRAGVLFSGYLSTDERVDDITFTGFTVKNAGLNPPVTDSGTHDGADNQGTLADSTATWTPGALVGEWVHNYGDRDSDYNPLRSYGQITANTATTVTVALSGGKENDWDNGDPYVITSYKHYYDGWESSGQESIPGIAIHNGKNVLIQNCKVENCGKYGISAGKARCTSLQQCEDVTIDNCVVLDNADNGISVGDHIGTVTITDNTCTNNGCPHIADATREYQGTGIQVTGSSSSKVLSGTISDNTCSGSFIGINMAKWIDGVTVEGNTVTGCNLDQDGAGIFFYYWDKPERCKNVIVRDNTVTGNIRGIVAYYASDSTIEGNSITTDSGSFPEGQGAIKLDNAHNITVKDNTISCDGTGITVMSYDSDSDDNSYDNAFTGNMITGAKFAGVLIYGPYARDNTFTCNTITGTTSLTLWGGTAWEETQADGVFIDDDAGTGNVFNCNNIYGNAGDGMENQIGATVDAENNWWGCDGGPGAGGCDTVVGNVDYDPWLTASSTATATGTGTASFAAASCGSISGLTSVTEGSLPTAGKPNISFPHGFFSFDITGLTPGATVTVTITLPTGAAPTQYWKYHVPEGWIQIPMTVVGPPNVITITLVDGGLGDDDGLANGVIVDQGGPGAGAVGWETYPVNSVRVLLPWIALGVAIAAGASLLVVRRRRTQS
jgi:parallel beta-helix repeat protein